MRPGRGSLPFDVVYPCFQQICLALQALHDRGIVHRDVKPANLILTPQRAIVLLDLGIAKVEGHRFTSEETTKGVVGTDAYLAPEQVETPSKVDGRADVFAAGKVTYELLTGILPRGTLPKPSEVNPTVPKWFDNIVLSMMRNNPADRPFPIGKLGGPAELSAPLPPEPIPPPLPRPCTLREILSVRPPF